MRRHILKLLSLGIVLLCSLTLAHAAAITSKATGNWNAAGTWTGGVVPGSSDNVTIANGTTVTVTVSTACSTLTIASGNSSSSLILNPGISLAVSGVVTINNGTANNANKKVTVGTGTLSCSAITIAATGSNKRTSGVTLSTGTVTVAGDITMGDSNDYITLTAAGTLNLGGNMSGGKFTPSTGNVNFNGNVVQTIPNGTYIFNNIQVNNTSASGATFGAAVTAANITGSISVGNLSSGSLLNTNNLAVTRGASGALTVAAGSTLNAGTTSINWSGTNGTAVINGTFKTANTAGFSGTTLTAIRSSNNPAITLGANSTIDYNAPAGGQAVTSRTYSNLTMNNTSGTQTAAGTVTVSGTLTTATGGTLNMGVYQLVGALTTVNHSGTIQTQNTSATPLPSGKTWGGAVQYNALAGLQTIMAGTYNNLLLSNTSGTQSAGGALTVNGGLTTTTGGFLNMGTNQLLGTLTSVSNGGTLQTLCTTNPPIPAGKTWGGTVQYNALTGTQTIMAGTYNNLWLSNTSGTELAGGVLTVNGILTTTSGGTLNMGSNQLLGALATVTNGGILQTQCTTNPPVPTGKSWGGTVVYNATSGGQTVMAGTYNNLTLSNTSGAQTASGALVVNGVLTTSLGGSLNMGTNQLSGTLVTANNGSILTQNIGTTPIPAGKTWGGTIQYNSTSGAQTCVAGTYTNLTINNSAGVTLSGAAGVSNTLLLTNGKLTTSAINLLTITNTSATAISGGTATSFINGPVLWTLPASLGSGTTYNFPVGKGSAYLPFALVNAVTGTGVVTAQVEAFASNPGGTYDATLASISNTEYWSLTTSGNFTGSSISLSRPSAIAPLDVVGASASVAGSYTCLEGTSSTYGVSGSNPIGSSRFFTLAAKKSIITTMTITGGPFCAKDAGVSVPFTYMPKVNFAGATFTAQLSNASGSFTAPVTLQNVASNSTGSQSLNITIPNGTNTGTGYRIRIVSNSPAVTGSDNGTDLIISSGVPSQPGTITGSAAPCANAAGVTYSVTNVPGVTYTWSFPAGWTQTAGGNTNSVTVTTGSASGNIQVIPSNGCGNGTARTLAVAVVPGPAITVQPSTIPQSMCQNSATTALSVSASGTSLSYQWYQNTVNSNSGGTLLSGATTSVYTPSSGTIGTLYYYCVVSGTCAPAATSQVSGAVTVAVPQALTPVPGSRCGTGRVTLSVTGSSCIPSTVSWFDAQTGGNYLNVTNTTFTTPSISSTTTYYAEEKFTGGLSTIGGGSSTAINSGLVFDLNEQIVLNSVQVSASGTPTSITIGLQDKNGTAVAGITPKTFTPVVGTQTVTLGWTIPSGTGYRLVKTAGTMALLRTNSYSSWPVGFDVGSFTSSIENSTITSTVYNFFYNLSFSRRRVAVTATIGAPIVTGFSGSKCGAGQVTLKATATAGTISWYATLTGGSAKATGTTYAPDLSSTTTYYVASTDSSCTTSPRVPVVASIITAPLATAGGGGTFCSGSNVSLTSSGTYTNSYWTGPNNYYSLSANPTLTGVTSTNSGVYTLTGSSLSGVNLVSNGNFEDGNTGFGSSYGYVKEGANVLIPEGLYTVVVNPNSVHTGFTACPDHSSGTGLQMVINGTTAPNVSIWSQTVNVVPNTNYQYTYWVQSVVAGNPSALQLYINGSPAGPIYRADSTTCSWRQFTYNWNSGLSTSAYLSLVNQNITPNGNDFTLDDIVFQQTCETTVPVVVTVNNEVTAGSIGTAQSICPGYSPAILTSTAAGSGSGALSYEWQTNASGSYVTIESATSADFSPPPLTSTTSYQRRTISLSGGLTCYSPYTTPVMITVTAGPTAIAGGPNTVCQSASPTPITLAGASVGGTATTAAWSIVSGGGSLSNYAQTANPAAITYTPAADYSGTVTLRLTSNNVGCAAVADRIINITPTVGLPTNITLAGGTEPSCQLTNGSTTTTYTTTATDNTGFTWSLSTPAAGTIRASTGIMTWASGFFGTVDIQVKANGCNGPSLQVTRTVSVSPTLSAPVFDMGPTSSRCQASENVTYAATADNSTDITYTLDAASLAGGNTIDPETGEVTYSADWTGTSTITASASGCNGPKTATHIVTIIPDGSWTGAVDNDWNNPANWACGQLPSLTTNVLIANGKPHYPTVSNDIATCKNLTIQNAASVTVDGNIIQIAGVISNSGSFTSSAGIIEMEGDAAQTIPAGAFTGNTIMDLNINNPSEVTLAGPLSITGTVRPLDGTLNSGGNLTLVSTSSQTALIYGEGSGNVLGTVNMQRYLPASFGYKYFSSPFQNATVGQFSNWVNLSASFPTFRRYDENNSYSGGATSGWIKYINPSGALDPMAGYAANFGTSTGPVTVVLSGIVNNGTLNPLIVTNHNMTFSKGFNLVGNPYPSPIDWDSPYWIRDNVDDAIYFFSASVPGGNALANDSLQYQGTYSSYINGVSTGGATNIIPAMQAFFVNVPTTSPVNGSINFNNDIRVNDLNPAFKSAFFTSTPQLRLTAAFDGGAPDAAVIYFDDAATLSFDGKMDALKIMNTDYRVPSFYFKSADSQNLSISGIPFPRDSITRIPIGLKTAGSGRITFEASGPFQLPEGLYVYLEDDVKGIYSELKPDQPYQVSLNAGTYEKPFALVFSFTDLSSQIPVTQGAEFTLVPIGGIWVVNVKLGNGEKGILQLVNMKGQILIQREVIGNESVNLEYKGSSGVYVVSLISGNKIYSKKVIIQK